MRQIVCLGFVTWGSCSDDRPNTAQTRVDCDKTATNL